MSELIFSEDQNHLEYKNKSYVFKEYDDDTVMSECCKPCKLSECLIYRDRRNIHGVGGSIRVAECKCSPEDRTDYRSGYWVKDKAKKAKKKIVIVDNRSDEEKHFADLILG